MVSYIFILRRQLTSYKASRNYSSCYGAGLLGFNLDGERIGDFIRGLNENVG
jgi:hypothetical protein